MGRPLVFNNGWSTTKENIKMSSDIIHNGKTYFTVKELQCKGTGHFKLREGFAEELLALRLEYGRGMIITSACRSTSHNAAVGGAKSSQHISDDSRGGCAAVDIKCSPAERLILTKLALARKWSVGISTKGFIHLDARFLTDNTQAIFGY